MNKANIHIILTGLFLILTIPLANAQNRSIPLDTTYNVMHEYHKIKKYYPYAIPAKDSVPPGVTAGRNLVYAVLPHTPYGKRKLHVDVFRPSKPGRYPALVMIHGGGWRSGTRAMQIPMAEKIAKQGFVTVVVGYQLSLEAKYPAAIYNIKAAIRWLRKNAGRYDVNPDRIAISGCSSGGHLAALVGLTNNVKKFEGNMGVQGTSSAVQAIIDIDGVINFLAPRSLNSVRKADSPDVFWLGGTYTEKPATWKDASPIYWANKNSAPILFLNSGYPRFHAGQDELIGMLKRWGIYYEVYQFNVKMHPFWLFHPWMDEAVQYMVDFMNNTINKK